MSETEPPRVDQEIDPSTTPIQRESYKDAAIDRVKYRVSSQKPPTGWDAVGAHLVGGAIGSIVGIFISGVIEVANREAGMNLAIPVASAATALGVVVVAYAEVKTRRSQRE